MQYVVRYNIGPHKRGAFRQWLGANQSRLETDLPEGWRYLGTSLSAEGFDCETRWQFGSLEPLATKELPAFHALTQDLAAFIDPILPVEGAFLGAEGVTAW